MADLNTFLDLQNRVISYGYSEQHREQIKGWINDALRELYMLRVWRWLTFTTDVTTTAGTRTTALPAVAGRSIVSVLEVKPNDAAQRGSALEYEPDESNDPSHFSRVNSLYSPDRGVPLRYTLVDSNIVWDPIPDRAITYSVKYYAIPSVELTTDSELTFLPSAWTNAVVYLALMRAAAHDRSPTMVATWKSMADVAVSELEQHDQLRGRQSYPRARLSPVYSGRYR